MEIAATRTIRKRDGWWWVPSQAGTGLYRVQIAKKFATCECPDYTTRGVRCKHIFAATFVLRREKGPDGTITVTESLTVSATTQTTYPQNWAAYNQAQTNEKDKFLMLLSDLCNGIPLGPKVEKNGRPRLPLCDMIFSATFKVYSTVSGRRLHDRSSRCAKQGIHCQNPALQQHF